MTDLSDQIALVTGGGSGIGRAIAETFAKHGSKVVILGRHENTLKETAKASNNISYIVADLTVSQDIQKVIAYVKEKFGKLNTLVNNAGWVPINPISKISIEEYERTFTLDVKAVVALMIGFLPLLKKSKGNVINMSTITSHPAPGLSLYVGAKMALEGMSKTWALELGKDNVRVNIISPGPIDTGIWYKTDKNRKEQEQHKENAVNSTALKRLGKPQDIANMALYLASAKGNYITGADILVDGGEGIQ